MADDSWKNLMETWSRVKWARSRHYDSAGAAAEAFGMQAGTYRCYERGPGSAKFIRLDYDHARLFAGEFRVRWEWLLHGTGEPWLTKPDAEPVVKTEPEGSPAPKRLRAWREFRGLTVAELAKRSGLGAQTIAALEAGSMDASQKLLDPLAKALSTRAGFLTAFDPREADPAIFETVLALPKEHRAQVLEILRTFRPKPRPR